MSDNQNNKRIAKNSLMLYIRTIIITIVSFYTTRVTMQLLGAEDYGISNVISGIIGFMSIITNAMINAAQRFLAYDLGKNDREQLNRTFSMLINIFIIVSVVGVIVMELVGPWMINRYLVIPPERLSAAHWIFQFSIVGFVASTLVIPYTSVVIAYEKMDVFAYVSLLDAALKLAVVFLLYITPFDKLITVVFLTVLAHVISNVIYIIYCRIKVLCKYERFWDKTLLNKLSSFMGWNLFGTATGVLNVQGQAILLNMFFGPLINAAKAIADNVNRLVNTFVSNFFMAVGPQIVKTYANNERDNTLRIVLYSSKLGFFLIALVGVPIIFNMEPLLQIWLGKEQVTDYMVMFSQLTLVLAMIQSFEYPITQVVRATGDIKNYQIVVGVLMILFIPICYVFFKLGFDAIYSMIILSIITPVVLHYRIIKVCKILSIGVTRYYTKVLFPSFIVVAVSMSFSYILPLANNTIPMLLLSLASSFTITLFCSLLLGMTRNERQYAFSFVKKFLKKNKND